MNNLKVIGVLAFAATGVWWGVTSHQETEKQRAIVNELRQVVDGCKTAENSGSVAIQGKALVWDMTSNSRSGAHGRLPADLKAGSSDSPITVFMVKGERNVQVGTYSISRQPAYRTYVDICAVYWPEKKVAGMGSVVSMEPVSRRPVRHQPEYGDPNEPVAKWIATLPRKDKA